jgi:hypothetical protein
MGSRRVSLGGAIAIALALAPATTALADGNIQSAATPKTTPVKLAAATLESCLTATLQIERSATFTGEMSAIPGSARMLMRIDVQERGPEDVAFHTLSFPGIGTWLRAAPNVKTYKNLDRVTDLSAPANYRAAIRFRWLNAKGHLLKAEELHTARCEQPAPPSYAPGSGGEALAGGAGPAGSS